MKVAHVLLLNLGKWMMNRTESTVAAPGDEAEALEVRGIEVLLRLMAAAAAAALVQEMIEVLLMMIMRITTAHQEIVMCHVEMQCNGISAPACTFLSSPRP
jgi:hypothetical protein